MAASWAFVFHKHILLILDFTCSCLFNKEFGLVAFLSKAVTNDEVKHICCFYLSVLTPSSIYTHLNTVKKKKALGKHCEKR